MISGRGGSFGFTQDGRRGFPMPAPIEKAATFENVLIDAVASENTTVVKYLLDSYKDAITNIIRDSPDKYVEHHRFLVSLGIDLSAWPQYRVAQFSKVQNAYAGRFRTNQFKSFLELFHLMIMKILSTDSSVVIPCIFGSSNYTFSMDRDRQLSALVEGCAGELRWPANDFYYLDTIPDRKKIVYEAIVACIEKLPAPRDTMSSPKDALDELVQEIRATMPQLNYAECYVANSMFGLAVLEHHKVKGSLEHIKMCLKLVSGGELGVNVFNISETDTACILSTRGGTQALRDIFSSGFIPNRGTFGFSVFGGGIISNRGTFDFWEFDNTSKPMVVRFSDDFPGSHGHTTPYTVQILQFGTR